MIRIAILGAGRWGPNLTRNFASLEGVAVSSIVDTDRSRHPEIRDRFPGLEVLDNAEPVLNDASVDAVAVATPTVTHYDLVSAALKAGKHVFVEKPLAKTSTECAALRKQAEARGRVLAVGHIFLFNPAVESVKRYLETGKAGKVQNIVMRRTNLGPVRMDVNAGWDLASHDLSIANWWLGTTPISVSATGHGWINEGLADTVYASFRYPSDILCHIHASWLHPQRERNVTVVGSQQMLSLDDLNAETPVMVHPKRIGDPLTSPSFAEGTFRITAEIQDEHTLEVAPGEPMRAECAEFIECIQEHRSPRCDAGFAGNVVTALEAMDRSMEANGAPVPIECE